MPREPDAAGVRLRRVPHPFRAMLAICSDIDQTRLDSFREIHRFMNTLEETSMGRGVGLDVADSCWMYKHPFSGNPLRDTMAYFAGHSWETPSPYAPEMIQYLKCGWIDTLHSYGNFNLQGNNTAAFTREHAERAIEVLDANQIRLAVWVNHGDRNNRQNIGVHDFMEGDKPGSPAYHADLLRRYGVEFLWRSGQSYWAAGPSVLVEFPLADRARLFGFRRYQLRADLPEALSIGALYDLNNGTDKRGVRWLQVWRPQGLHRQIDESVLCALVEDQHLSILAQHLGSLMPLVGLDKNMADTFRRLRRYQDEGLILVARTSRLLQYNRVRDHLRFVARSMEDRRIIDIAAVVDPVRGHWVPQLEDLRGITFEVRSGAPAELWAGGKPLDRSEVVAERAADGSGVIGVRWFEPDTADYARPFLGDRSAYVLWSKTAKDAVAAKWAGLQSWLSAESDNPPSGLDPARYACAVRFAKERFDGRAIRSVQTFEQLGFVGMRLGLDLGCGPGHGCLAFLEHSRGVIGIDTRAEWIELAKRAADRLGVSGRAQFLDRAFEEIDYKEDTLDCAWSLARLMYHEAGPIIERVARGLTIGGSFYCSYNHAGGRLRIIQDGLATCSHKGVEAQIGILLNAYLNRCGVYHTPGSRLRLLDLEELLRVCRVFGLNYVGEPNLEEGPRPYLGIPGTFDFLVRKRKPHDWVRPQLLDRKPVQTSWFEDLAEISRAGCPGLVCDVLEASDPALDDPAVLDLYARSLVRAGRAGGEAAARLFEDPAQGRRLPDLTMGLYRHDQGRFAEALSYYDRLPQTHPDRTFLIGFCQLFSRDWTAAGRRFAAAVADGSRDLRHYVGWIAAHYYGGEHAAALRVAQALVESRSAE